MATYVGHVRANGTLKGQGFTLAAVLNAGGTQVVSSGGSASGTRVNGGFEVVYCLASASIISSGGAEVVVPGGLESGATVQSGGLQFVFGSATGTTLSAGGTQVISSGGRAGGDHRRL